MSKNLLNLGNYGVFLDAGFITDAFTLDSSTLDGLDVLDGSTLFFDVTEYVLAVSIGRGRSEFRQPIDAGRCTITIDDVQGDFSVVNPASPYWDVNEDRLGFTPTKRVKVTRDGEELFVGQIQSYNQQITLDNKSYVTVTAIDDLKILEKVTIATHTPTAQLSSERVEAILDRAEVQLFVLPGQREIEVGVSKLGTQVVEAGANVNDYFQRIQTAEQGRIFISRSGALVAQARTGREVQNVIAEFSDVGDGEIPFRSFEVKYQ
jgi:hypothetical protein